MEFDTSGIDITFNYSDPEISQIKRCLRTLYATKEGEQPLDRNFGLKVDFVGDPLPVAKNKFALEVVRKTAMYEPRAKVTEVTYEEEGVSGMLIPRIHLTKGEG